MCFIGYIPYDESDYIYVYVENIIWVYRNLIFILVLEWKKVPSTT